jgi:hypothetical protein
LRRTPDLLRGAVGSDATVTGGSVSLNNMFPSLAPQRFEVTKPDADDVAHANTPNPPPQNELVDGRCADPEEVSHLANAKKALTSSSNNAVEPLRLFQALQH